MEGIIRIISSLTVQFEETIQMKAGLPGGRPEVQYAKVAL